MAEEIEASDNGAYDKTYVLLADIDMTGVDWTPVSNTFYGVLDGNGHTISNLILLHYHFQFLISAVSNEANNHISF